MSRLKELIQELCPEGVEYVELKEISKIKRGDRITKKDITDDGKYIVMSGGVKPMGCYNCKNRNADTITISSYGAAGYIDYIQEDFWANDVCLSVFPDERKVNKKFLYYALKKQQQYIYDNTTKAIPDHMPTTFLEKLKIPLPPLEIQKEIAKILDKFTTYDTELQAELQAELQDRLKQYEYYRDKLLSLDLNIPKVKLGDIAQITRGGSLQKKDFTTAGFPCIHYGQIYTKFSTATSQALTFISEKQAKQEKKAQSNDVIMAITSENLEDVCKCVVWLGQTDVAVGGHTAIIHHQQNPKYLAYYFQTQQFFEQKRKYIHGTKVIEVSPKDLENIVIPLPLLPIQNRIVEVLDNFDKICSDLKIGLPAEIEKRQQQYEFYRDAILTFVEKGEITGQREREP